MAKRRRDSGSGDAVPIANMPEDMQQAARNLGFGKRCALKSVQKRAKTESRSIWGARAFGLATALVGLYFIFSAKPTAGVFMLLWTACCLFFAQRSGQRLRRAHEIEEFVRQQLGDG